MKHNRFDRIVWVVLLCMLILAAGIIWRGDRVGVQIGEVTPLDGGRLSAWGRIAITFEQPMQTVSVEEHFSIEPAVAGQVSWRENTMWFTPDMPYDADGEYRVTLQAGALSANNRSLKNDLSFTFRVRESQIIYLSNSPEDYELFIDDLAGSISQLTHSGGRVYDYTVSRDGEFVLYSAANEQGGVDLWRIQRDGSLDVLLLECGTDVCSQPALSPDGSRALYTRQSSLTAAAYIWNMDMVTGVNEMLFSGSEPSWSPDGRYMSVLDRETASIRVIDVQSEQGIELDTGWDYPPVWFPDSSRLVYADMQTAGGLPTPLMYQVDLVSNHVSIFLEESLNGMEFSMPAISPDGQQLVIALRTVQGELTKQLWLVRLDGSKEAITADKTFSNHSYHWDVYGERVLFQQIQLQELEIYSRVMIWQRSSADPVAVARDMALPNWLP